MTRLKEIIFYALACIVIQVLTASLLPDLPSLEAVDQLQVMSPAFMLTTMIVGAIIEELLVRGLLWWPIRRFGSTTAIVGTSVLFAALHAVSDPLHGLMAFGPGVVLGFARERHGLSTAIGAHITRNGIAWIAIIISLG